MASKVRWDLEAYSHWNQDGCTSMEEFTWQLWDADIVNVPCDEGEKGEHTYTTWWQHICVSAITRLAYWHTKLGVQRLSMDATWKEGDKFELWTVDWAPECWRSCPHNLTLCGTFWYNSDVVIVLLTICQRLNINSHGQDAFNKRYRITRISVLYFHWNSPISMSRNTKPETAISAGQSNLKVPPPVRKIPCTVAWNLHTPHSQDEPCTNDAAGEHRDLHPLRRASAINRLRASRGGGGVYWQAIPQIIRDVRSRVSYYHTCSVPVIKVHIELGHGGVVHGVVCLPNNSTILRF